jgi:hypothetical protein
MTLIEDIHFDDIMNQFSSVIKNTYDTVYFSVFLYDSKFLM